MRNKVEYEWANEAVDSYGDCDPYHAENLSYCNAPTNKPNADGETLDLVLVRDEHNDWHGLVNRQWAYVEDGVLPDKFDGGAKVPKRFHTEFDRWFGKLKKNERFNYEG